MGSTLREGLGICHWTLLDLLTLPHMMNVAGHISRVQRIRTCTILNEKYICP